MFDIHTLKPFCWEMHMNLTLSTTFNLLITSPVGRCTSVVVFTASGMTTSSSCAMTPVSI